MSLVLFILYSLFFVIFFHEDLCCVCDDATTGGDVAVAISATTSNVASMTPTNLFSINI